jgi:hypothetical protein
MRSEELQKLTIIMASSNACLSFEGRSSSSDLGARNWKALGFSARYGSGHQRLKKGLRLSL